MPSVVAIGSHRPEFRWERTVVNRGNRESLGARHWKGVKVALLIMLAIGQSIVVGQRILRVNPPDSPVAIGHDVSGLLVRDSGGETIELGAGDETLLLVFDPDCAHTARVAEAWASWLADEDSGRHRTIAVSPGPLSAAVRYARDSHWSVRVGAVESPQGRTSLLMRTGRWLRRVIARPSEVRPRPVEDHPREIMPSRTQVLAGRGCTLLGWKLVGMCEVVPGLVKDSIMEQEAPMAGRDGDSRRSSPSGSATACRRSPRVTSFIPTR